MLVGTEGFQPLLLLGLVVLEDKKEIHKKITSLQDEIKMDSLYNSLKCVSNPKGWYFHARNDQPEIRTKFIELFYFCLIINPLERFIQLTTCN